MKKDEILSKQNNPPSISTISTKETAMIKVKKDKRRRRRRSIIREFSLNTSTHGLPGIARSESIHNRVFWSISFLGFTIITIYFVTKTILAYLKYPTRINVDIVSEWPQNFPAVSLCNASPFRLDRFVEPFLNYTNAMNFSNVTNASTIPHDLTRFISRFLIDQLNKNISLDSLYYTLPSILRKCAFNSIPCLAADFIPFYSPFYGLCHTFNARMKNTTQNSVRNGNEYGGSGILELELYAHIHQYIPDYGSGAGFVVLVHDNRQAPSIEAAGVFLEPGRQHKLNFKKKAIFLLPAPYSSCIDSVPLPMKVMYDHYYQAAEYVYSEVTCYGLCVQGYVYQQCGCINPVYWSLRSLLLPGADQVVLAPLCYENAFNSCYVDAMKTIFRKISLLGKNCFYCARQCTTIEFLIQKSALAAPLDWQFPGIKAFVENSTIPLPSDWSTAWKGHIYKSYLALSVIRETATIENVTQTAQVTITDVISNIGGQTGLWIGISFLSMMEFIEMVYRLIRYQCHATKLALRGQQVEPT